MNKTLLLSDLAALLEVEVELLNDEFVLDPEGSWDSLAIISVIGAIDQHYAMQISGDCLAACQRVGDIFNLIQSQNIEGAV